MVNGPYIPQVWMVEPRAGTLSSLSNQSETVPLTRMDSTGAKLLRQTGTTVAEAVGPETITLATIGGDYPAHLPSDEDLKVAAVNWKVLDGVHWMSTFDRRGVSSAADWQVRVQDFKARGLTLTPWNVPVGLDTVMEVGRVSDLLDVMAKPELVLNVEYWGDQYFWQGGKAGVKPYMDLLRRRQPHAKLTLQYDTRNPDTIHLEEWLPYVDQVIDMSYWPDFGEDMRTVLYRSYWRMQVLGKPFSFTYPGTADVYPDWQIDQRPIYVFRRGNMTPACVTEVQRGGQQPEPRPDPGKTPEQMIDDLYRYAIHLTERVETLEKRLEAASSALRS